MPAAVAEEPTVTAAPVTLTDTQQWTLHGEATGRDYLIQVSIPDSPPPVGGYPVLYVLDGNARFPLAVVVTKGLPDAWVNQLSPWKTKRGGVSARKESTS